MTDRLIPLPVVRSLVSLSRSQVLALVQQGRFPSPVRVSNRAVRWREREVLDWIESRPRVVEQEAVPA